MAESIWGGEAAPHPTQKEVWTVTVDADAEEAAGIIDLSFNLAGSVADIEGLDFNATAAAVQSEVDALDGPLSGITVEGVSFDDEDGLTFEMPMSPVGVAVEGVFDEEATSVEAVRTSASSNTVQNVTVANPTGATRNDGTANLPRHNRDYGGRTTPKSRYEDPDGTAIVPG